MSNIVKTKFAGLLRGLLRRVDDSDLPEVPRTLPQTPPPSFSVSALSQPQASPQSHSVGTVEAQAPTTNADELELPLQPILAGLPMDLRGKIIQPPPPGTTLIMPVEKILSQLAQIHRKSGKNRLQGQ